MSFPPIDPRTSPQVSVVLSVFKNIESLSATLASVVRQRDVDAEVLLVDDGNEPRDRCRIKRILDDFPTVKLIENPHNFGLTRSLNIGCSLATAPLIARLDNGDLMVPRNRLQRQRDLFVVDPNLGLVGGGVVIVDIEGGNVYRFQAPHRMLARGKYSDVMTQFPHVTVMFRKDVFERAGGYDPQLRVGQDTELWPRMLALADGQLVPEIFAVATMSADSISVRQNRRQVVGKIRRIVKEPTVGTTALHRASSKAPRIAVELLKLCLPNRLRMRLKYKRNLEELGQIPSTSTCSLEALAAHLTREHETWLAPQRPSEPSSKADLV
jgi:glycosyltransferase involved in cell wall biosynthesis